MEQEQAAVPVASVDGKILSPPARRREFPAVTRTLVILIVGAAIVVLAVHWPALSAKTIFMDDHQYLGQNPLVQNPSLTSAVRVLVEVFNPSTVGGYYQPLTMISLMFDHAMGGRPGNLRPFHRTSLLLHVVNTALVIVFLYFLFHEPWPAAFAGLLFGVHPLTVESIPWVAERKTLLAAFFALCSLALYVRYVRRKGPWSYRGCLAAYVLALMSKPTALPVPLLMLLLDYWPLGRLKRRTVVEKLPFFAAGAVFAVITLVSQGRTSVVKMPDESSIFGVPLIVCHNVILYLYHVVWPANLSAYYPFPKPLALSDPMVLAGVIGTCVLVLLLLLSLRWTRAILTGCLFFLVAILPALGVIGFMGAIAADRFAYLPLVGLLLPLTWLLGYAWSDGRSVVPLSGRRVAVVLLVFAAAVPEALATRRYLGYWQDRVSLYRHIVSLAPKDPAMRNGLGYALHLAGRDDEAIEELSIALELLPGYAEAHINLGIALAGKGRLDEAIEHYMAVLRHQPANAEARVNLGSALFVKGRMTEAAEAFREALRLRPNHMIARHNLGEILARQGKLLEAADEYARVLQLYPDHAPTHTSLARVLAAQGRVDEAVREYRTALRLDPRNADAHRELTAILSFRR